MTDLSIFLEEHPYVDYSSPPIIRAKAEELFPGAESPLERVRIAYEFVRDEIPHCFDIGSDIITSRASDVLAGGNGGSATRRQTCSRPCSAGSGFPPGSATSTSPLRTTTRSATASTATTRSIWTTAGYSSMHAGTRAAGVHSSRRRNLSSRIPTGAITTNTSGKGSTHRRRWASCGCSTPLRHGRTSLRTCRTISRASPISSTGDARGEGAAALPSAWAGWVQWLDRWKRPAKECIMGGQSGMQGAEQEAAEHGRAPESIICVSPSAPPARIPLHRHAQRIANRIDRHIHVVTPPPYRARPDSSSRRGPRGGSVTRLAAGGARLIWNAITSKSPGLAWVPIRWAARGFYQIAEGRGL